MKENNLGPRDIYRRIDFDGDGSIGPQELRRGLHFLYKGGRSGCHIPIHEAEDIVRSIDGPDGDAEISMEEVRANTGRRRAAPLLRVVQQHPVASMSRQHGAVFHVFCYSSCVA